MRFSKCFPNRREGTGYVFACVPSLCFPPAGSVSRHVVPRKSPCILFVQGILRNVHASRPDGRRRMLMRCDGMCSRQSADYCPRQVLFFVMHGISVFLTRKAASGRRGNGGISTMERFCALPYPRDRVGRTMTGAGGISARRRGGFPIMQEYPDRRLASLRTMGRKAVRRSCGRGAAA